MPIKASTPVVIPSKSFDNLWLFKLLINAPEVNSEAWAEIVLQYYNDAGDVGPTKRFYIQKLLKRMQDGEPLVTAAYDAIMAVVDAYSETPEGGDVPDYVDGQGE